MKRITLKVTTNGYILVNEKSIDWVISIFEKENNQDWVNYLQNIKNMGILPRAMFVNDTNKQLLKNAQKKHNKAVKFNKKFNDLLK